MVKRSGATEPFERDKAIAGVRKACNGRPVTEDDLACLGQQVEDALRQAGAAEVARPRDRDGDSRRRCASSTTSPTCGSPSVYKQFESADDFEVEIESLRRHRAEQLDASCSSHLSPQRLTTDHPVRRGEAAYRVHHLGAPWQPCGYVGATSNNVEQGPTRVGTEEHIA